MIFIFNKWIETGWAAMTSREMDWNDKTEVVRLGNE